MNTPQSSIDFHKSYNSYPQMKSLFESLKISEETKNEIHEEFSRIAKIVYENPQGISSDDIIRQIKMWATNPNCFEIKNGFDKDILRQYFAFIERYPHWEKIWRILSVYYKSSQS